MPPMSRRRSLASVFGFVLVVAVAAVLTLARVYPHLFFPGLFERERANPAELAALADAPLTPPERGTGWPQWLGPTRDGRAPDGPLNADWAAKPPKLLWTTPCGGGHSSFALVNGLLVTQDYSAGNERVIGLDAATGAARWTVTVPVNYDGFDATYANGPRATPSIDGDRVYAVTADGQLLAIDIPATGTPTPPDGANVAWRHDLIAKYDAPKPTWGVARSPLVHRGTVIVQPGAANAMLVAFDCGTGREVWRTPGDPLGYSSPTVARIAGVEQVVAVGGTKVVGADARGGAELWSVPWATQFNGNIATPLVVDDYVFVSSSYAKGCGLFHVVKKEDGFAAETVYFRPRRVMQNHHANCVARDGYLYGYDGDELKCVNLRKGEVVPDWDARDPSNKPLAKGCVILAGDKLLGLTHDGTLFLADADPKEFTLRGFLPGVLTGPRAWALPVLVNGRVYLRDDTKVVSYDVTP
jgi:outer membrane protein assembly factor BamB